MTKRNIMTENLREEIAKELGVYEQVKKDGGWENIPSKTCGNMITKAIVIKKRNINKLFIIRLHSTFLCNQLYLYTLQVCLSKHHSL